MFGYRKNSIKYKVVEYIREHPNCSREEIISGVKYTGRAMTLSTMLSHLRTQGVLDHNGQRNNFRWHVVEYKTIPVFLEMAEDIFQEFREMHPSVRPVHLAQRLEELLGETIEEDEEIT